jgi:thiosulfate reductase cytochrome b subunit
MKRNYLHPLPLRIWHWANALTVIVLIITGIQIRISGMTSLGPRHPVLPIHKYIGWAMAAGWVIWLVYGLISDHLSRHYLFRRGDLKGTLRQARFYLVAIFRGEENPFRPSPDRKFNPLQKLAYGSIMGICAPVVVITGLLFSDISFLRKYILLWNAAGAVNAIHVIAAYVFLLYLVFHVYMATLGPTIFSHMKAMISGYEEEAEDSQGVGAMPKESEACRELPKE